MLTLIKKMEIQLTPQYLKERGISLASLINPFTLQTSLHSLLANVPGEYVPNKAKVSLRQKQDAYSLSYELERIPIAHEEGEEPAEPILGIEAEADAEVLLDQAVFTVNDNRFCKKQVLTFVNTPMTFVREYLDGEDCVSSFRRLSPYAFEVSIMPKMD